jgi:hypothetical protein
MAKKPARIVAYTDADARDDLALVKGVTRG